MFPDSFGVDGGFERPGTLGSGGGPGAILGAGSVTDGGGAETTLVRVKVRFGAGGRDFCSLFHGWSNSRVVQDIP